MTRQLSRIAAAVLISAATHASAQTICGVAVPPPASLPPEGSAPVIYAIAPCFERQGSVSSVDPQTYLYYIHLRPSQPSQGLWLPYDDAAVATIREDFRRLWGTSFLEDLSIESEDFVFTNGVVGKLVTYHLVERERIKLIDYTGSKKVERTKIDEKLRELNVAITADSFRDDAKIRRAESVIRSFMADKGFANAEVTHTLTPVPGGSSKLVNLTFNVLEGPQLKIRTIDFIGNAAFSDAALTRRMKTNKPRPWWMPFGGKGTYRIDRYEEDVERVGQHYRNNGFLQARVGSADFKTLKASSDGKTRWVEMRIPVTEGGRYRIGEFGLDGNTVLETEPLRQLFEIKQGEYASEERIRRGLQKAQEAYGASGYMEFTGYPDYRYLDEAPGHVPAPLALVPAPSDPTVDVTMRLSEGKQFFVNRISFVGNTTTRDNVIRRELQVLEGAPLNLEALKYSVRRINQLGYFKPLEEQKVPEWVQKVDGTDNRVDLNIKVEEQNRNQINFGAGVSEYEGIFGNISYATSNLFGRGESFRLTLQKGARSSVYDVSITEPYLFDRPITGSIDLYSRKYDYETSASSALTQSNVVYSEVREGTTWSLGRRLWPFTSAYLAYTYEAINVDISDDLLSTSNTAAGTPLFNSYLDKGRHVDSRIAPGFLYNTVDSPIMAHSGTRLSASLQLASPALGSSYSYLKPEIEAVHYIPTSRRTGFGLRANAGLLRTPSGADAVPYYLRYFLGGETQIRGVDLRTVGPLDSSNRALGGNKFVLFNAEYYLDLFGPVRLLAFHDAGQAFDATQPFSLRQLRTSSGGEARVFLPVLNVPFRLIYFVNVYRDSFQPARGFKFAVGTTF